MMDMVIDHRGDDQFGEAWRSMIEKGQKAIPFTLNNQYDQEIALADFYGQQVFIFFFPGVDTLNDQVHMMRVAQEYEHFRHLHVAVLGICGSTGEQLAIVSRHLALPYFILADEDGAVRRAYDVWNQKMTFGTPYWITARTSLLIDETGLIYKTYRRAAIETNAQEVVAYLTHRHDKAAWRKLSRRTKERLRREWKYRQAEIKSKKAPAITDAGSVLADYRFMVADINGEDHKKQTDDLIDLQIERENHF